MNVEYRQIICPKAGGAEQQRLILLTDKDKSALAKVMPILEAAVRDQSIKQTETVHQPETQSLHSIELNRICYDLLSFLGWFVRQRKADLLIKACTEITGASFDKVLSALAPGLVESFAAETDAEANCGKLWEGWLKSFHLPNPPTYMPSHIQLAILTPQDWSRERIDAAAKLIVIANAVAYRLCID